MRPGKHRQQSGFTYLFALLMVAVTGASTAAVAQAWSHVRQREKEAELMWVGNQFRTAIGLYYQRSPGSVKRYPEKLKDLLEDRRFLTTQRYLRKIYADPLSTRPDWEYVYSDEGGIMGVQSKVLALVDSNSLSFVYEPPPRQPPGVPLP